MATVIVKKSIVKDWPAVGQEMEIADDRVAALVDVGYVELPAEAKASAAKASE